MRPSPETGDRWAKQSRHTSQMDRLRKRGEELALAAPARPSGRDGVMASPPQPRRRWLLEGAGAAFQHVLTAFQVYGTVGQDQWGHQVATRLVQPVRAGHSFGGFAVEESSSEDNYGPP